MARLRADLATCQEVVAELTALEAEATARAEHLEARISALPVRQRKPVTMRQ